MDKLKALMLIHRTKLVPHSQIFGRNCTITQYLPRNNIITLDSNNINECTCEQVGYNGCMLF